MICWQTWTKPSRTDDSAVAFEIIGGIEKIETIAVKHSIRELARLEKYYGQGRWRKLKGVATVVLSNREAHAAELHWYEAHGIGRKEFKIKRLLD